MCAQASSGTYPPPATADRKSRGPECGFLRFPLISGDQTSEIHALQKSMPNCWHPIVACPALSCFALGFPSPRRLARAQVPYVHHLSALGLGWSLSQDQDVGRRKSGATRFCGASPTPALAPKWRRFSFSLCRMPRATCLEEGVLAAAQELARVPPLAALRALSCHGRFGRLGTGAP